MTFSPASRQALHTGCLQRQRLLPVCERTAQHSTACLSPGGGAQRQAVTARGLIAGAELLKGVLTF